MGSVGTQAIAVMQKIDKAYAEKMQEARKVLLTAGKEMLAEFRNKQMNAQTIKPTSKREKPTGFENAEAEAYAKMNAGGSPQTSFGRDIPWTNRTKWAASGVHSYIDITPNEAAVGLYHTMSYGVYLELANNRRYAIIEPLVRKHAPKLMEELKRLFGGGRR